MKKVRVSYTTSSTDFYFSASFSYLKQIVDSSRCVIITDEHVFDAHSKKFKGWNCIVLKAGEHYKVQATVDSIIEQLIEMEADRKFTLIGVGGGVVTDITGYAASIFLRGINFGFAPTSLLAMVDAAIGGKNGIDVGIYKNMAGTIRQPSFIFYDTAFLKTLPDAEWRNGFTEIIKHACIKDAAMFRELEFYSPESFMRTGKINELIQRNAMLKAKVVKYDEFENGERRLLNFGHTIGHALENQYELSHGQAISIGMTCASHISESFTRFNETGRVVELLKKFGLPAYASFDKQKVFSVLRMDKKRQRKEINFVLLQKIGKAVVQPIELSHLEKIINSL